MKKFWLILAALVVAICCGVMYYLASTLLEVAVHPEDQQRYMEEACLEQVFERYPEMRMWHDTLQQHGNWRDTVLTDSRGLRHHGIIISHDSCATGSTVILHGYNDNAMRMSRYAYLHYEELGRNVIVPDHYGHGQSDGDHIRFAWLDRLDIHDLWLPLAHQLWPDMNMVLHGLSMGGAMTMFTAGTDIADSLRLTGFIEDCGYTSTWDELKYQLKHDYGFGPVPLLYIADWLCFWKYGWSFKDGDVRSTLANCTRPMLFIHGAEDTYVPTEMVQVCYDAKKQGYKELWVTEGSDHAQSIHEHWDEYVQRCREYIDRIDEMSKQAR